MNLAIIVVAGAVLLAGEPAQPSEKSRDPATKKVCRTEQATGSRLQRKRICATKRVWEQVRENHQDATAHWKGENADLMDIPRGPSLPGASTPTPR